MIFEKIYTDEGLVDLLKQKDKNAFSLLYDKYANSFYGIILNNLNQDEKSAEYILQDAFMKIWKSIEVYDNTKEGLFAWMFKIVGSSIKEKTGVVKKIQPELLVRK